MDGTREVCASVEMIDCDEVRVLMMSPIEQLALVALQRASEAEGGAGGRSSLKSFRSITPDPDNKARVALRKERNRQSAASSRKRAKLRTEELEEENVKLKEENQRLRRLLDRYLKEGGAMPDHQHLQTGFSSHSVHGADDSDSCSNESRAADDSVTTSSSPLRAPSLIDSEMAHVLLPIPRGNLGEAAISRRSFTAGINA